MHIESHSYQLAFTPALVVAAIVYLRGWSRLRAVAATMISTWRAVSFLLGLILIWVAVASPIASSDERMLTGHMIQHLLLTTLAPPLIWLSSPVMSLWQAFPALARMRWRPLQQLGILLGDPVFCWLLAAGVLVLWHIPAVFELGMKSAFWHLVEHASFLGSGLLFWWPVVQPWPSVPRWPRWSMLLYLFLATLPCDVLSGFLVFSDRIAYGAYLCMAPRAGFSALEDQQCAGALMWTCVTVVFLVAGTIVSVELLSPRSFVNGAAVEHPDSRAEEVL